MTSPRALFVSGIDGFCHRYAVLHRASHLRSCGWEVSVLPYRHSEIAAAAAGSEIVFFYRVPANLEVMRVLEAAGAAGVRRVGLVDDLIFRPEVDFVPSFVVEARERELWQDGAVRYAEVLQSCDEVLASSEELVAEVQGLGLEGSLYRDALAPEEFALGAAARAAADGSRRDDEFRLGYFSGTATHAADFACLVEGLVAAMQQDPQITLRIRGPLPLPRELSGFAARISRGPLVPWVELPDEIAAVDLNLAPLDVTNRFTAAKGATKVMEAAACGVPSIASPTTSHGAAIVPGSGWLAGTSEDWYREILAASAARDGLAGIGQRARAHMEGTYGSQARVGLMERLVSRATTSTSRVSGARVVPPADVRLHLPDEPLSEAVLTPDAFPALVERSWIDISPPLGEGDLLRQTFRVSRSGLFRLDLFTLTYGQSFDHSIGVRLLDPSGQVCAQTSWDAQRLPDHGFFAWELENSLTAGSFILEMEAIGTGPGNAASFGLVAAGEDRGLAELNGFEISGALGLRGFSAWDQVF